jgi:hypothetical protein
MHCFALYFAHCKRFYTLSAIFHYFYLFIFFSVCKLSFLFYFLFPSFIFSGPNCLSWFSLVYMYYRWAPTHEFAVAKKAVNLCNSNFIKWCKGLKDQFVSRLCFLSNGSIFWSETLRYFPNCSWSRRRPQKVDKRMVLEHTHGLFIT